MNVIPLLLAALVLVSTAVTYHKASKPFWAAIIPFYAQWVMYEIADTSPWYSLIYSLPLLGFYIVSLSLKKGSTISSIAKSELVLLGVLAVVFVIGLFFYYKVCLRVAEKFNHSKLFGFLLIFLLSPTGWPILAFTNDEYRGSVEPVTTKPKAKRPKTK